ncbi:hypothetical protein SKAU_G00203030 [Synaphobranchus kaupii]|uniref:Uncharacterized protein n=1 Tax=Synaphobranchus kaupii TaxID=118154 RepID=A0A9Q1FFW3_SYNKA|nr:hypothetical protein SKAU_G00203030 [Synaphobranchus kaupii]
MRPLGPAYRSHQIPGPRLKMTAPAFCFKDLARIAADNAATAIIVLPGKPSEALPRHLEVLSIQLISCRQTRAQI